MAQHIVIPSRLTFGVGMKKRREILANFKDNVLLAFVRVGSAMGMLDSWAYA